MTWKHKLLGILVISTMLKIVFALVGDTGDTGAFDHATQLFLRGNEVYSNPTVYLSPPPFFLHFLSYVRLPTDAVGIPFQLAWKFPSIFADVGITILIFVVSRQNRVSMTQSLRNSAYYAFNPITLFVSGFHGQAESTWVFLILLSWFVLTRYRRLVGSAVIAGVALAYKLPALLLIPGLILLVPGSKKIVFVSIMLIVFVLSLLPELVTTYPALKKQVFEYNSAVGIYGVTGILSKVTRSDIAPELIRGSTPILKKITAFVSLFFLLGFLLQKKKDFLSLCLSILGVFLVFTPGFATQYLLWPLPFIILVSPKRLTSYSVLVTFCFLHTYGLPIALISRPLGWLQTAVYYKTKMLYPYDFYYLVWIMLMLMIREDVAGTMRQYRQFLVKEKLWERIQARIWPE